MDKVVSIPVVEYQRLTGIAERYDRLKRAFTGSFFEEPTTTSKKEVIKEFKATGRYNADFLKSLSSGLKDSSFFS